MWRAQNTQRYAANTQDVPQLSHDTYINGTWHTYRRVMAGISMWRAKNTRENAAEDLPMRSDAHCNTLQHTATHCNTLQHTATHCQPRQYKCSKGTCRSEASVPVYCCPIQRRERELHLCPSWALQKQGVGVCGSMLQRVVKSCSELQCVDLRLLWDLQNRDVAMCCNMLQ